MNHTTGRTGHLYAIEFSSGTVKVGQSRNIARRIASHEAGAARHGVTADCIWISEPIEQLDERERELLAFCARQWQTTAGDEYFRHADITKIIEQANNSGVATQEVRRRPMPAPNTGVTYGRPFKGHAAEAAEVRAWTRSRVPHPDAPRIAHELFVAILGSGADTIDITLSTAGRRLRITATGPHPLPLRHSHGPGWPIVAALCSTTGITTDECGLWAQTETTP